MAEEEAAPKIVKEYNVNHQVQKDFNPQEWQEHQKIFASFDTNFEGKIKKSDVPELLKALGHRDLNEAATANLMSKINENEDEDVTFDKYIEVFRNLQVTTGSKEQKGTLQQIIREKDIGYHSYNSEETSFFSSYINSNLEGDQDLANMLPLNPESDDLFAACASGVLLCKLVNIAVPGTIFPAAINTGQNMIIFKVKENCNMALSAAKSIGVVVISINANSIIEKKEHLLLALIWQLVKIHILSSINLKQHPELVLLVEEGEELQDLLSLPPESLLLRWINYHLKRANSTRKITNFKDDVMDSEIYTILLNQIQPNVCDMAPMNESDLVARAGLVLTNAKRMEVDTFVRPVDIAEGNSKLNLCFAAAIFNKDPGLHATEEQLVDVAELIDDDVEGTREERAFRMWINSLNLEDVYVNNLYTDVRDGLILLKAMDKLQPGCVEWNRAELNPNNKFKRIGNGNLVIATGKALRFHIVGISGNDIVDGNKKLILGFVWQLVRFAILQVVGEAKEEQIVAWANERVNKPPGINGFKDSSLSNSLFLFDIFRTIEAQAINEELITSASNEDELKQNAQYLLSVARKLGCSVFCVWNDIVEVNPKMIMTIIASALALSKIYNKNKMEEVKPEEALGALIEEAKEG